MNRIHKLCLRAANALINFLLLLSLCASCVDDIVCYNESAAGQKHPIQLNDAFIYINKFNSLLAFFSLRFLLLFIDVQWEHIIISR